MTSKSYPWNHAMCALLPNVFTYDDDGTVGTYTAYGENSSLSYQSSQKCSTGDVNGDGLSDYMCNYGTSLRGAMSNGDGTFSTYAKYTGWPNSNSYWIFTGDVNRDGKTDYIFKTDIPAPVGFPPDIVRDAYGWAISDGADFPSNIESPLLGV